MKRILFFLAILLMFNAFSGSTDPYKVRELELLDYADAIRTNFMAQARLIIERANDQGLWKMFAIQTEEVQGHEPRIVVTEEELIDNRGAIVKALGVSGLIVLDYTYWHEAFRLRLDVEKFILHEFLRSLSDDGRFNDDNRRISDHYISSQVERERSRNRRREIRRQFNGSILDLPLGRRDFYTDQLIEGTGTVFILNEDIPFRHSIIKDQQIQDFYGRNREEAYYQWEQSCQLISERPLSASTHLKLSYMINGDNQVMIVFEHSFFVTLICNGPINNYARTNPQTANRMPQLGDRYQDYMRDFKICDALFRHRRQRIYSVLQNDLLEAKDIPITGNLRLVDLGPVEREVLWGGGMDPRDSVLTVQNIRQIIGNIFEIRILSRGY